MRIISGKYKGYKFKTYNGDNTRPTSDLAKEGLFSSLENIIDIEGKTILDLFAGTGNIGLEFLSRDATCLTSVDSNFANIRFMKSIEKELDIKEWQIIKSDALSFKELTTEPFDIIFADPPYNYTQLHTLLYKISKSFPFQQGGRIFILEHSDKLVFDQTYLLMKKQYGSTCFSVFRK